jgi:hypothetical protein
MGRMRKGIGPIAIAAIAIVAVMVIWGISIYFLVGEHESIVRSTREREIIKMINEMEWVKKIMPKILEYSFYQSSYSLASMGGYFNPNDVPSYNCIPYWRVYGNTYFPDSIESNLNKTFINYLGRYASKLGLNLPNYEITFQEDEEGVTADMKGGGNLVIDRGIARVEDKSDFSKKFNIQFFDIFETGKKRFVDEDSILPAVINSLDVSCEGQKDKMISELQKLETDQIKLDVIDVQVDCNGHAAAKVLVRITSPEQYPVYDYEDNTTELRNVQLKFFVVSGNAPLIEAETNVCEY